MTDDVPYKDILDLDEAIHAPVRLAILMLLIPRGSASFPEMQEALELTSGNLSSHLKKLQKPGYVDIDKKFIDLKPTTLISITLKGKNAVKKYSQRLKRLLDQLDQ